MEKVVNQITNKRRVVYPTGILVLLSMIAMVSSAQGSNILEKKVLIKSGHIRIDNLFKELKRQTGAEFSYSSTKINPSRTLNAGKAQMTVADWLHVVERSFNLKHTFVGNHIILIDHQLPAKKRKTASTLKRSKMGTDDTRVLNKKMHTNTAEKNFKKENFIVKDTFLKPGYSSLKLTDIAPGSENVSLENKGNSIQMFNTSKTISVGDRGTLSLINSNTSSDGINDRKEKMNRLTPASNNFFLSAELNKTNGLSLVYNRKFLNSHFGIGAGLEFIDISTKKLGGIMPSLDLRYYIKVGRSTFIPFGQAGYNFWSFTETKLNSTDQYTQKGGGTFSLGLGYSYRITAKGSGPFVALKYRSMQYRYTDPLLNYTGSLKGLKISAGWMF